MHSADTVAALAFSLSMRDLALLVQANANWTYVVGDEEVIIDVVMVGQRAGAFSCIYVCLRVRLRAIVCTCVRLRGVCVCAGAHHCVCILHMCVSLCLT